MGKLIDGIDFKAIIKNAMGEVVAEQLAEDRDKANADLNDPEKKAARLAKAAEAERALALPSGSKTGWGSDPIANKDPAELTSMEKATLFVRGLQCQAYAQAAGGGRKRAIARATEFGQGTLAKAMAATDFDDGGFLMQQAFADGVIEALVPRSVYMRAGPQEVDLPEGGLSIPFESDGADAQWAGEGVAVNAEDIKGGQINLQPRELVTVVPVSDRMLRGAPSGRNSQFITNSILKGMRTKLDATLLRGVGASSEPKGLAGFLLAANQITATSKATLTQADLVEELLEMQTVIETLNIDLATDNPWYFFSPRTKNFLRAQRATDGLLFPEIEPGELDGRILGARYGATSNIPNNVSAAYSEIYFVAMNSMILGKTLENLTSVFEGGSYTNASGVMVSGISKRQTVIRMVGEWDHAAGQRGNEIARMDDVDWV